MKEGCRDRVREREGGTERQRNGVMEKGIKILDIK